MFCGVFVENKKLDSNLHTSVYISEKNLDFCSAFEIRWLVESLYIKTNGLFQYKTRTTEWFDNFFQNALRKSIL